MNLLCVMIAYRVSSIHCVMRGIAGRAAMQTMHALAALIVSPTEASQPTLPTPKIPTTLPMYLYSMGTLGMSGIEGEEAIAEQVLSKC